jgi:histidinol dehydrogenase
MIPILLLSDEAGRSRVEGLLRRLALDPADVALGRGDEAAAVQRALADVRERGDDAVVDAARRFDDPAFTAEQIRVTPDEMRAAAARVPARESTR